MIKSLQTRLIAFVALWTAVATPASAQIDLQGHRGARGLLPENTIPSVIAALDHGADTIELDVVISADGEVVVSHEAWMSAAICRTPDGGDISTEEERSFNIFELTYAEVAAFDCGGRGHREFPRQQPMAAAKPLLRAVVRLADGYAMRSSRPLPRYNIEIKSSPGGDGRFHPGPDLFVRIVYDLLEEEGLLDRTNVQSFDPRPLRVLRELDASLRLAFLVSNDDGYSANLERLGFRPEIYSPRHDLVDAELVNTAHNHGVLIIPWTVNDSAEMERLLELGVDGIITDYPDMGRDVIDAFLSTRVAD